MNSRLLASWCMNGINRPLTPKHDRFSTRNIFLMGPPGSGKTTVARELALLLNKPLIDIDDHWLEPRWQCSIESKLAELGDEKFVEAEGEQLLAFDQEDHVVSLTGSSPLNAKAMDYISRSGIFVYLDVPRQTILDRCDTKVDRIVGQGTMTLNEILDWRQNIYENFYDIRIIVGKNERPLDIANKICRQLCEQSKFYRSTRDDGSDNKQEEFLDVIEKGLAADGGLYVPESFSPLSMNEIERFLGLNYPEIALRVIERFPLGRLHPSQLRNLLEKAYSSFPDDVLPVHHLGKNEYLIETYHGPTASFKDLSLQLLPWLMQTAMHDNHRNDVTMNICGLLVATSGDTGCAALDGFSRISDCPVIVLYPKDGVSIVQQLQMQTATGNVCVLGVDGDFDFCQKMVKDLLNDEKFHEQIKQIIPNLNLSSANSMNWARFVPQIVFSFSSYIKLVEKKVIQLGDPIDICIPTGNFGNMLGAIFARRLGLPIRRLIAASNENKIITDFIQTGIYDLRNRPFYKTISPSIDILISSNVERFIHLVTNGDTRLTRQLFDELSTKKYFSINSDLLEKIKKEISADWCSENECLSTIEQVYRQTNKLIDPHTAVAVNVAEKIGGNESVPILISSTAHFGKFPQTILKMFEQEHPTNINELFDHLERIPTISTMHKKLSELKNKEIRHKKMVLSIKSSIVNEIEEYFKEFSRSINHVNNNDD